MIKGRQETLNKAFNLSKKYEMENGDCAQCVFAGVTEALGVENNDVFRAATGFADGVGLTGDGHCGALSGGVMAISYIFGRKRDEFIAKLLENKCRSTDHFHDDGGQYDRHGTLRSAGPQRVDRAQTDGHLDRVGRSPGIAAVPHPNDGGDGGEEGQ